MMNEIKVKQVLDKIIKQVLGVDNKMSLEQLVNKLTFDVRLPRRVSDITDGSTTWTQTTNPTKFIKLANVHKREEPVTSSEHTHIQDLADLLKRWDDINFITSEHVVNSVNVSESDSISESEGIFHSQDIHRCNHIYYCDCAVDSEFLFACQRSGSLSFCIRADDSINSSNCFGITQCGNLTNCIMMHDCVDMQDSMFCTSMRGKRFCVANMQLEEDQYNQLRKEVVNWLLNPTS